MTVRARSTGVTVDRLMTDIVEELLNAGWQAANLLTMGFSNARDIQPCPETEKLRMLQNGVTPIYGEIVQQALRVLQPNLKGDVDLMVDCRLLKSKSSRQHPAVKEHIGVHPDIMAGVLLDEDYWKLLYLTLQDLRNKPPPRKEVGSVLFLCSKGRHRSVALAELWAHEWRQLGLACGVTHVSKQLWHTRGCGGQCTNCIDPAASIPKAYDKYKGEA